ncbi:MAG: hypothetical protein H6651_07555 [Ardenticatenales bacterium]|nr:hypothetical protein [Ardenticatenales bacterium]
MGRYAEAIDLVAEARAEYQALGDPRPIWPTSRSTSLVLRCGKQATSARRLDVMNELARPTRRWGQQWAAAVTYMDRAILAEEQACFATAEDLLGQARAILAAEDLANERAHVDLNLGILAFKTGWLQAALHHLELAYHELESQQLAHAVAYGQSLSRPGLFAA